MIARVILIALISGTLAGWASTAVQALRLTPLILQAEAYETGDAPEQPEHDRSELTPWDTTGGLERFLFTALANMLTGVGFGLLLAAAVVMRGKPVDFRACALWGMAGFATFAFAPALGLPPELPGSQAAELVARQLWWLATAGATGAGLALIVFARRPVLPLIGAALLVLPHILGAPHPERVGGSAPPELAASFAVLSLAAAAVFWVVLGASIGFLFGRTNELRASGA